MTCFIFKTNKYEYIIYVSHTEKLQILGKRLQKLKNQKGYSQTKFFMMLNITREHLLKIERGAAYPS